MRKAQKERAWRFFKGAALLVVAGLLYAGLYRLGLRIPCPFYGVTGLYCPGCGMSRMCMALLHLDVAQAVRCNFGIVAALPVFALLFGSMAVGYIRHGRRPLLPWQRWVVWALIVWLLLFGIARNLPQFSFLQPLG